MIVERFEDLQIGSHKKNISHGADHILLQHRGLLHQFRLIDFEELPALAIAMIASERAGAENRHVRTVRAERALARHGQRAVGHAGKDVNIINHLKLIISILDSESSSE